MLFPELHHKKFGEVNLNAEAQRWLLESGMPTQPNPLLDPTICQRMVDAVSTKYSLDFSYGGWLEDRRELWRGSYLDEQKIYVHLGIDFNVPARTSVATDHAANVLLVDCDFPAEGGWGNRVIMKLVDTPIVMVYAHFDDDVACKAGDTLVTGDIFAHVGAPARNGGWFSHLHVQCVNADYFAHVAADDLDQIDGYGAASEIELLKQHFVNPLSFISLT